MIPRSPKSNDREPWSLVIFLASFTENFHLWFFKKRFIPKSIGLDDHKMKIFAIQLFEFKESSKRLLFRGFWKFRQLQRKSLYCSQTNRKRVSEWNGYLPYIYNLLPIMMNHNFHFEIKCRKIGIEKRFGRVQMKFIVDKRANQLIRTTMNSSCNRTSDLLYVAGGRASDGQIFENF